MEWYLIAVQDAKKEAKELYGEKVNCSLNFTSILVNNLTELHYNKVLSNRFKDFICKKFFGF